MKRPHDWGAREKHPLYDRWRYWDRLDQLAVEWKDFWNFVESVGEVPYEGANFKRFRKDEKFGPGNWTWRSVPVGTKSGEDKARYMREYRIKNPRVMKHLDLKKMYGTNIDWFEQKLKDQNGVCAICKKPESSVNPRTGKAFLLAVDHCHATKKLRGLLCHQCNRAIGQMKHDIPTLQAAIAYLQQFEKEPR